MRPKVIFFALLISLFISLSPCKVSEIKSKTLTEVCTKNKFSFGGELKFERVLKSGKWWIYVYEGSTLVDVYPE